MWGHFRVATNQIIIMTVFKCLILIVLESIDEIYQTFEKLFFHTFSNTSKFVRNIPLRVAFATLFSVSGNVVNHVLSCLIYYWPDSPKKELCVVTELLSFLSLRVHKFITHLHALHVQKADLFNMLGFWIQALSLLQENLQMLFHNFCAV